MLRRGVHHDYIQEFDTSETLDEILLNMKINEIAETEIKSLKRIEYGWDHEILKRHFGSEFGKKRNSVEIVYRVQLYYFQQGVNKFTLNIDNKIKRLHKRQQLVKRLIQQKQYKWAQEQLEYIENQCTAGHYQEDSRKLAKIKQNAQINLTFCYWKLKNEKDLREKFDALLRSGVENEKVVYRLVDLLYEKMKYREIVELLEKEEMEWVGNKGIKRVRERARERLKEWEKKEKRMFKRMMGKDFKL